MDPAKRLIAQTLETEWNQCLIELETARKEYQANRVTQLELSNSETQMQDVITHLHDYWYKQDLTLPDKIDLLRCLIEQVFLQTQEKIIRVQIHWQGGSISELDVPKYLFSTPYLFNRIRALALTMTGAEIAAHLNGEKILTA